MRLLVRADEITIPLGEKILSYKDDSTPLNEIISDGQPRDIFDWIDFLKVDIVDIVIDENEMCYIVVPDITLNPVINFLNRDLADFLGFYYDSNYGYDNSYGNGMNIYGSYIGYGRFILEETIGENMIGTDGSMFQPHTTSGGWTVDGRSFREENQINITFWKLETYGLTVAQAKSAVEFSERLGSNIDLVMLPSCFPILEAVYFQFLAHEEYLKQDDMKGYYKVEYEVSERVRAGSALVMNDRLTYLTKNDDITFLER